MHPTGTARRHRCALSAAVHLLALLPSGPTLHCAASPAPDGSAADLIKAIESGASRDMAANDAAIFNWSPFSAHKYSDADLSIEAYRRPRLRGIGGLLKGR
jgi:hypothetical protein